MIKEYLGIIKTVAVALAGLAIVFGLHWTYRQITNSYYEKGKSETELAYVARDAKAESNAQKEIARLKEEKAAVESKWAESLKDKDLQLERKNREGDKKLAELNARIDTGTRMRDPFASRTNQSCPGGVPANPASTAVVESPQGRELSEQATRFLSAIGSEANALVRELNYCWDRYYDIAGLKRE